MQLKSRKSSHLASGEVNNKLPGPISEAAAAQLPEACFLDPRSYLCVGGSDALASFALLY